MSKKNRLTNCLFSIITGLTVLVTVSTSTYLINKDNNLESYDSNKVTEILTKIVAYGKPPEIKSYTVVVINDPQINAYSMQNPEDNSAAFIIVNKGILKFLRNDDELALVLAHEWSHVVLGHTRIEGLWAESPQNSEMYADLLGQQLAKMAGYDPGYGADIWHRMLEQDGDGGDSDGTHPRNSYREQYLRMNKTYLDQIYEYTYKLGETLVKLQYDHSWSIPQDQSFPKLLIIK